jgi:hypothetical protein
VVSTLAALWSLLSLVILLRVPERVRRPSTAREALGFSPLVQAGWADSSCVEGVPLIAAGTEPFVFFAGRPATERAADAWGAGVLLPLRVAVWSEDRIVRNRTHGLYCDPCPDYSGRVTRFTISPTSEAKTEKLQGSDNISLTFEHGTVPHITGAGNASEHSIRNHEEREVDTRGGVL